MSVIYNTLSATSDRQDTGNDLLNQILAAIAAASGGSSESQEVTVLNSILSALAPLSTSGKQDQALASLASILAAFSPLATSSKQDQAIASLASILAAFSPLATSAKQDIAIASLSSIDSKIGSSISTLTQVACSASSVSILASNPNRKGFYLYNNTTKSCFVAFAATATSSAFTLLIAANSGYESSQAAVYRGAISAIWSASAPGQMQVTELT